MRLKKVFAVFFTFCLIFSVSLQAAFADIYYYDDLSNYYDSVVNRSQTGNIEDGVIDTYLAMTAGFTNVWGGSTPADRFNYLTADGFTYLSPIVGSQFAAGSSYPGSSTEVFYPALSFTPATALNEDFTWYFGVGMVNNVPITTVGSGESWSLAYYGGTSYYSTLVPNANVYKFGEIGLQEFPHDSSNLVYPYATNITRVRTDFDAEVAWPIRQVDVWCNDLYYQFTRSSNSVLAFYVPYSFVVPTSSYLDIFDEIYTQLVNTDNRLALSLPQIYGGLQNIVTQLEALNTDTDTIIEILNQIKNLDQQQLSVLNYILTKTDSIDTTVKQIYALMLSEVDGSHELSDNAGSAANSINTVEVQEQHWQTNMNYNFAQLESEGASLTVLGSGLALVGNMFTSIWSAFGEWNIIFTFPLTLGIALLVIGRMSKHDRKVRADERRAENREYWRNIRKGGGK